MLCIFAEVRIRGWREAYREEGANGMVMFEEVKERTAQ
jgi:hypothetical protein